MGKDSGLVIALVCDLTLQSITLRQINSSFHHQKSGRVNLLIRLDQTLAQAGITYEAIVVDDHSTDDTIAAAEAIARERNLPVRILIKQGRPGKSFSLIEGFAAVHFDVLVMIDGDLQCPPEALLEMSQCLSHADIVVAYRHTNSSSTNRFRATLSRVFNFIISLLFGIDTDIQSGLKVFHRKVYEGAPLNPGQWSLDLHLITRAIRNGYTVANVPVTIQQRHGGTSKVRPLAVGMELLMVALQLKITLVLRSITSKFGNH